MRPRAVAQDGVPLRCPARRVRRSLLALAALLLGGAASGSAGSAKEWRAD